MKNSTMDTLFTLFLEGEGEPEARAATAEASEALEAAVEQYKAGEIEQGAMIEAVMRYGYMTAREAYFAGFEAAAAMRGDATEDQEQRAS